MCIVRPGRRWGRTSPGRNQAGLDINLPETDDIVQTVTWKYNTALTTAATPLSEALPWRLFLIMSKKDTQITESSGNVFADLGFEQHEAENLLVRARLMTAIKTYIESEGITQREAAERFNVAQPRISEIYQGKIELFSADKLINMLAQVGRHVEISINEAA